MKKRVLLTTIALIILLSGCAKITTVKNNPSMEIQTKVSDTVTDDSTEPVTEIETNEEFSKETETEPSTETQTELPTEPSTEGSTVAPSKPTPPAEEKVPTQIQTEVSTIIQETQSVTETPTTAPVQTQAPTQAPTVVPTEPQTEAVTEAETETINQAIAERDAFVEKWYHEAYVYPWDFEYIEAELRAYGESLGMTYETEEYIASMWYDSPQLQQWYTFEQWMEPGLLTPDNANWHWPKVLGSDDNTYTIARNRSNLFAELDYHGARNTHLFRLFFELSEDGQNCIVYILY